MLINLILILVNGGGGGVGWKGGLGYHHGLSRVPIRKLAFKDIGLIWIH